MKKIVINLSPQKETVTNVISQTVVSYAPLVGLTAALVAIIIFLLQMVVFKQTYEYAGYQKRWKAWEGRYEEIKKIKQGISKLKKEKKGLEEVVTPEYDLAFILSDIASSLPENVWFEGLEFKKGTINLRGYVIKWGEDYLVALDGFINSLREKKYFSSKFKKASIKESKKSAFNSVETLKFIIECAK
ncbi:MAG: hypothetical protein ABIE75_02690 [Candidatus Omnitrophota bacterium]